MGVRTGMSALVVLTWFLYSVVGAAQERDSYPAFHYGEQRFVYKDKKFRDMAEVDFRNWTYFSQGIAEYQPEGGTKAKPLTLTDGKFSWRNPEGAGFEDAELDLLEYFQNDRMSSPIAIVGFWYVSGAGSSTCLGVTQFFRLEEQRVLLFYEITHDCHGNSWVRLDREGGRLEVASVSYMEGDSHCCPSKIDVGEFSLQGSRPHLVSWKRIDHDQNVEPRRERRKE